MRVPDYASRSRDQGHAIRHNQFSWPHAGRVELKAFRKLLSVSDDGDVLHVD